MRASRLISILTTLQARGRVTAQALADECEVSLRTIYRDIDALSTSGIPVYSERGPDGGYRLLDGYRVRLNGLTPQEAESLFLTGLAGPAVDLGLSAVMAGAELKLLAALPEELRSSAKRMRARFHLDAPAWFGETEHPPYLHRIANAVWGEQTIEIRYRSWKGEKSRRLEPLGLVLKSGAWYLVAQVDRSARTYRISRILDLTVLDERFIRPENFDLGAYWATNTQRLEADLNPNRARVRLSPNGLKMLEAFSSPYARAGTELADKDDIDGWQIATIPVGSIRQAAVELIRLGSEVEVIEPLELRAKIIEITKGLCQLYKL